MENFAPEFKTPEQYIRNVTYKIWEQRGVARLDDWYGADCHVHTPHGVDTTRAEVYEHTLSTMHLFPNREIFAEDVIIGEKQAGFLSSHRARSVGTHLGDGLYGPASNRTVAKIAVADCYCRDNMIVAEWLLGDQADLVQKLGIDPVAFGRELGQKNPNPYVVGNEAMRQRWSDPDGVPIIGDEDLANFVNDTYASMWGGRQLNVIDERYDRAVCFEGPAGLIRYGRAHTGDVFSSILASIPAGTYQPHHLIALRDDGRAPRVALRWSYSGMHNGHGRYGEASGVPVSILGISHFELREGKICREWMVIDETAIHAQIAAHQSTS